MSENELDRTVTQSSPSLPASPTSQEEGSPSLVGETVEQYHLETKLGEGGHGQVYLATDMRCGRQVAIKLLQPELRELIEPEEQIRTNRRFAREVHATQSLCHPNLIQVLDYQAHSEYGPYFVMEYLKGYTLKDMLKMKPRLLKDELLMVFGQICDGLQAVHEKGIVYRDLKPGNVYIVPIYRHKLVKLLDFGIALLPRTSRLTQRGEILGTPQYMSPEQILDPAKISHLSDVYSFGMLFYFMLTGERLIKEKNLTKLFAAHCRDQKPMDHPLATIPISRALSKLLMMNPDSRPQSITEAWGLLESALETEWSSSSLLR